MLLFIPAKLTVCEPFSTMVSQPKRLGIEREIAHDAGLTRGQGRMEICS